MIKLADIPDLPRLAEQAHKFYEEANLPGTIKPEIFIVSWTNLLVTGYGAIWMMERDGQIAGALGATLIPDVNDGELVAHEMFWFVIPEFRGGLEPIRLLKAYEETSIKLGAKRVIMTHIANLNPESLKSFYELRGYKPIETNYLKNA